MVGLLSGWRLNTSSMHRNPPLHILTSSFISTIAALASYPRLSPEQFLPSPEHEPIPEVVKRATHGPPSLITSGDRTGAPGPEGFAAYLISLCRVCNPFSTCLMIFANCYLPSVLFHIPISRTGPDWELEETFEGIDGVHSNLQSKHPLGEGPTLQGPVHR